MYGTHVLRMTSSYQVSTLSLGLGLSCKNSSPTASGPFMPLAFCSLCQYTFGMNSSRCIIQTGWLPIVLWATISCSQRPAASSGISVQVTDEAKIPLKGATVVLNSSWFPKITDVDGRCVFPSLPEGDDYVLDCQKYGFVRQVFSDVSVARGRMTHFQILLRVDNPKYRGR